MANHSVSEICISVSKNTEIYQKKPKNPQFFQQCCGAATFLGGSGYGRSRPRSRHRLQAKKKRVQLQAKKWRLQAAPASDTNILNFSSEKCRY